MPRHIGIVACSPPGAAVLCCTELPLLFQGMEPALPLLDSTRILATAALERSQEC